MAAIIKSSAAMANGSLVALSQEVSISSASELSVRAEYCCLAAYADRWSAALRVGAPAPLPVPSVINYYNLLAPPALASVSTNISQGLCYFSCQFSAPRDSTTSPDGTTAPQFETTTQSTIQTQQISGSYTITSRRYVWNAETRAYELKIITKNIPWTLRYQAETKTVTANTSSLLGGDPNLFIGDLYISAGNGRVVPQIDYRSEAFVSSKGERRFSLTGQISYVDATPPRISES